MSDCPDIKPASPLPWGGTGGVAWDAEHEPVLDYNGESEKARQDARYIRVVANAYPKLREENARLRELAEGDMHSNAAYAEENARQAERIAELERERDSWRAAAVDGDGTMWADRFRVARATIARVEALAERWRGTNSSSWAAELRAELTAVAREMPCHRDTGDARAARNVRCGDDTEAG